MKKKLIILLGLMVFMALLGLYAIKKYRYSKSDFIIEDGVLVKYKGHDETVTIPDGVYCIGTLAFNESETWVENTTLKKLIMPDSVIIVDNTAFAKCYNLSEVVWSKSLNTIGEFAFSECTSLRECILPSGVTYIGMNSFSACTSLEKVVLPDTFAWYFGYTPFRDCERIKEITVSITEDKDGVDAILSGTKNTDQILIKGYEGTDAQDYAQENHMDFQSMGMLPDGEFVINSDKTLVKYNGEGGDVIVPEGVEYLAAQVFANNQNIRSVALPNSVRRVGTYTFGSSSITAVQLSENLDSISYLAFRNCRQLAEITIPKKVRYITSQSFTNCPSLKRIYIPKRVKVIDGMAFDETPDVTLYSNGWNVKKYAKTHGLKFKYSTGFKESRNNQEGES